MTTSVVHVGSVLHAIQSDIGGSIELALLAARAGNGS